jgi:hypothetical protein
VKDVSPRKNTIPPSPLVNRFEVLEIEESSDTDDGMEIVSEISTPKEREKAPELPEKKETKKSELKEWTPEWIRWNLENHREKGVRILNTWTHKKRKAEVTEGLVDELLHLREQECREAITELRRSPQWIRKIDQSSVMIPVVIETLDDRRGFTLDALLDCGATGCYVDEGFAKSKFLNMERLPRPIPVYNADGTHNEGGPIEHVVNLRLQIGSHSEVFPFAVTNTGKTDLIIGYTWLREHNPSVDWKTGKLTFNRCPPEC